MGCAPPVKVEPRKNDDVEYWLDMLGGEHKEKLKDWLATVRRTDRPTCALYLEGPPGTGTFGMWDVVILEFGMLCIWDSRVCISRTVN